MKLIREGVQLSAEERNNRNKNWTTIEESFVAAATDYSNALDYVANQAYEQVLDGSKLEWQEPVATFADLAASYPQAEESFTAQTTTDGAVYRFDGAAWKKIQQIDAGPVNEVDARLSAQLADKVNLINVKAHGAKGDGVTDDWGAIQGAIVLAETLNRPLYLPEGTYFVSQVLRTRHQRTYHYAPGLKMFGAGKNTIIKGDDLRIPATYGASNVNMSNQALLAIHGSNNTISDMMFQGGKVGLFVGQDPRTTEPGSSSMNVMEKLWFYYNGTSILYQNGDGCHYNKTRDVHIAHSQIGLHLGKGLVIDRVNNNRNTFDSIRVTRSWIGYLLEEGDGNMFNKVYAETIQSAQAIGTAPAQLPAALNGKPTAIVVLESQYIVFDGFAHEACDWDIYSEGFRCSFVNGMIKDDAVATFKVIFPNPVRQPLAYSANSFIVGDMKYQPSANTLFPGSNGTQFTLPVFDAGHALTNVDILGLSTDITAKTSASRSYYIRLSRIVDWVTLCRFTVNPARGINDPVRIKLPDAADRTVSNVFTNELTTGTTFPFDVDYGTSTFNTKLQGRFSTPAEATAYGSEHVIIKAPAAGWHIGATANYMAFQLRYMKA